MQKWNLVYFLADKTPTVSSNGEKILQFCPRFLTYSSELQFYLLQFLTYAESYRKKHRFQSVQDNCLTWFSNQLKPYFQEIHETVAVWLKFSQPKGDFTSPLFLCPSKQKRINEIVEKFTPSKSPIVMDFEPKLDFEAESDINGKISMENVASHGVISNDDLNFPLINELNEVLVGWGSEETRLSVEVMTQDKSLTLAKCFESITNINEIKDEEIVYALEHFESFSKLGFEKLSELLDILFVWVSKSDGEKLFFFTCSNVLLPQLLSLKLTPTRSFLHAVGSFLAAKPTFAYSMFSKPFLEELCNREKAGTKLDKLTLSVMRQLILSSDLEIPDCNEIFHCIVNGLEGRILDSTLLPTCFDALLSLPRFQVNESGFSLFGQQLSINLKLYPKDKGLVVLTGKFVELINCSLSDMEKVKMVVLDLSDAMKKNKTPLKKGVIIALQKTIA